MTYCGTVTGEPGTYLFGVGNTEHGQTREDPGHDDEGPSLAKTRGALITQGANQLKGTGESRVQ